MLPCAALKKLGTWRSGRSSNKKLVMPGRRGEAGCFKGGLATRQRLRLRLRLRPPVTVSTPRGAHKSLQVLVVRAIASFRDVVVMMRHVVVRV